MASLRPGPSPSPSSSIARPSPTTLTWTSTTRRAVSEDQAEGVLKTYMSLHPETASGTKLAIDGGGLFTILSYLLPTDVSGTHLWAASGVWPAEALGREVLVSHGHEHGRRRRRRPRRRGPSHLRRCVRYRAACRCTVAGKIPASCRTSYDLCSPSFTVSGNYKFNYHTRQGGRGPESGPSQRRARTSSPSSALRASTLSTTVAT